MGKRTKVRGDVLVATIGVEPQVVTLTLDALLQRHFPVTCVYVLHPNEQNPAIANAVQKLRREREVYRGKNISWLFKCIREGEHCPSDFSTEQDVALLLRVIYKTVKDLKRKGYRLSLIHI